MQTCAGRDIDSAGVAFFPARDLFFAPMIFFLPALGRTFPFLFFTRLLFFSTRVLFFATRVDSRGTRANKTTLEFAGPCAQGVSDPVFNPCFTILIDHVYRAGPRGVPGWGYHALPSTCTPADDARPPFPLPRTVPTLSWDMLGQVWPWHFTILPVRKIIEKP